MAKKVEEVKKNKVIEILQKEYPVEKLLLGGLGMIVLILGVYLIEGQILQIRYTDLWIFNTDTRILLFAIFVVMIGATAFILAVYPFFVPSFAEMKKVSWPTKNIIVNHSARVFGFIFLIAFFFVLIDFGLNPLFEWINELGN